MSVISSFGNEQIAGQDCFVTQISTPPAETLWSVYCFDKTARSFVNVCPEPREDRDAAIRAAEELLSDPIRYSRMCLMAVQDYRNDAASRLGEDVQRLKVRVSNIEMALGTERDAA